MADYRVEVIDLSLAANRKELVSRNTLIGNVAFLVFPAGTDLQIHFGQQAGIPVTKALLDFRPCPEENDGLYITHSAQPGVSVTVLIGLGGGEIAVGS